MDSATNFKARLIDGEKFPNLQFLLISFTIFLVTFSIGIRTIGIWRILLGSAILTVFVTATTAGQIWRAKARRRRKYEKGKMEHKLPILSIGWKRAGKTLPRKIEYTSPLLGKEEKQRIIQHSYYLFSTICLGLALSHIFPLGEKALFGPVVPFYFISAIVIGIPYVLVNRKKRKKENEES